MYSASSSDINNVQQEYTNYFIIFTRCIFVQTCLSEHLCIFENECWIKKILQSESKHCFIEDLYPILVNIHF